MAENSRHNLRKSKLLRNLSMTFEFFVFCLMLSCMFVSASDSDVTEFYEDDITTPGSFSESCQCNGYADSCDEDTGTCYCQTKGVIGDHCDTCDHYNNFIGEPTMDNCFYQIHVDYEFTYNLSKPEDVNVTQINFQDTPSTPDVDTEFKISASKEVQFSLSAESNGKKEWIVSNFIGTDFNQTLSASNYTFGKDSPTVLRVYTSNFTTPISITVSIHQSPKKGVWDTVAAGLASGIQGFYG